jgi:hypothetical protein
MIFEGSFRVIFGVGEGMKASCALVGGGVWRNSKGFVWSGGPILGAAIDGIDDEIYFETSQFGRNCC